MQKSQLSLARLSELLVTEKAASGQSGPTLIWYAGAIRRYTEWLERQELAPTLGHFTLDLVRGYIVDLQHQQARAAPHTCIGSPGGSS